MLDWLVDEKRIALHIPVFDKSKREEWVDSVAEIR